MICDREGCVATARLPVALRSVLAGRAAPRSADGWLFVLGRKGWQHYCPACIPSYLDSLNESATHRADLELAGN